MKCHSMRGLRLVGTLRSVVTKNNQYVVDGNANVAASGRTFHRRAVWPAAGQARVQDGGVVAAQPGGMWRPSGSAAESGAAAPGLVWAC
jgi:hypothetical protein